MSEILPVPGVEVLGTFPKEVQGYVVMAAGVSSKAAQGSAANELIRFLMAPAGSSILKSKGMERP